MVVIFSLRRKIILLFTHVILIYLISNNFEHVNIKVILLFEIVCLILLENEIEIVTNLVVERKPL